jgi:hypothetical protein
MTIISLWLADWSILRFICYNIFFLCSPKIMFSKFQCDTCELAKHHFVSFPACGNKSTKPFVIVHLDVWSPIVVSQSRFRWIVTFIDDYSRTTWVYLMKDKSDISLCFQIFIRWFIPSSMPPLKLFILTVEENTFLMTYDHILLAMSSFIKQFAFTPHN